MKISKSKFVAGAQCLKRLYLQVHQPELAAEPGASGYAIMEQGHEVGRLAHQLFPGGVEVDGSAGLEQAIRTTQELIANPEVPAIFEAAFEHDGVFVRVDILHRRRDNRWRLIEVKSTTDLKDYHLDDVAIQHRVVSRCGLDLASSCLAHINRNYVFDGGSIDVRRFFKIRNLTQRVERLQPKLTFLLRSEFRILAFPQPPPIPVGSHCTDPITCEFYDLCNPPRPTDHIDPHRSRGPSPCTWGERTAFSPKAKRRRTIPTHVGRTFKVRADQNGPFGPSPRTWGEPAGAGGPLSDFRTIPTHVGRTNR
jgi:hypothetical protein